MTIASCLFLYRYCDVGKNSSRKKNNYTGKREQAVERRTHGLERKDCRARGNLFTMLWDLNNMILTLRNDLLVYEY